MLTARELGQVQAMDSSHVALVSVLSGGLESLPRQELRLSKQRYRGCASAPSPSSSVSAPCRWARAFDDFDGLDRFLASFQEAAECGLTVLEGPP